VSRDGDAFAIYYAGWSERHPERGVTMAIATGEWTDGSGAQDRVSIGLSARSTDTEVQFTIAEPEESPWGETPLFGKMLSRDRALMSASLAVTLEVAELVSRDDPRLSAVLGTSETVSIPRPMAS
jgi:hypothetical protein